MAGASIRAIETRRPVVRAANTGISCIIDVRGKRKVETEWWHQSVLIGQIFPQTCITPYVKYGDYLMIISLIISALIVLVIFVIIPVKKKYSLFS